MVIKEYKGNKIQQNDKQNARELSIVSISLGIMLSIFFGAANAYLGLRAGLTISASIPASVISMTIIRIILKRNSILENNMVQTIASAGESIAGGVAFTLPAWFLWARDGVLGNIDIPTITIIAICGGVLGVLFMIPLRKDFIRKRNNDMILCSVCEAKTEYAQSENILKYPEGLACAKVLQAANDGSSIKHLFSGLSISCIIGFLTDMFKLCEREVSKSISSGIFGANNNIGAQKILANISFDVSPALIGVGYICKIKTASYILSGAILAWFILVPLVMIIGANYDLSAMFTQDEIKSVIGEGGVQNIIGILNPSQTAKLFTRYIGAGAMAAGGIISIVKNFKYIKNSIYTLINGNKNKNNLNIEQEDLDSKYILIGIMSIIGLMYFYLGISLKWILLTLCFGFAFTVISAQIVGAFGSTNCPISGMTILTVIVAGILLSFSNMGGADVKKTTIIIGAMISTIAAIAGDTSQDLKTGLEVGANPKKQQIGEIIGILASSLFVGMTLYLLDKAFTFGSEELRAPQASLIKTIIDSVTSQKYHVELITIGAIFAICFEMLGVGAIPIAIGMYLPFSLSSTIMLGGILSYIVDYIKEDNKEIKQCQECKNDFIDNESDSDSNNYGILFSAGLITGEGLVGIIMALYSFINTTSNSNGEILLQGSQYPILMLLIILGALFYSGIQKKSNKN